MISPEISSKDASNYPVRRRGVSVPAKQLSGGEHTRSTMPEDTLSRLARTIAARRTSDAGNSYTRQLLDAGPAKCARKLGEEAVETVIAALTQDADALKAEAADLLYHLLVLLEARNVALDDVYNLLEARMGQSGIAEKASRSRPQDE
jgi:phosphoribosyl-ATP pyrophosphohydrolase